MTNDYKEQVSIDIVTLAKVMYTKKLILISTTLLFLFFSFIYTNFFIKHESKISLEIYSLQNLDLSKINSYNEIIKVLNDINNVLTFPEESYKSSTFFWKDYTDYLRFSIHKEKKYLNDIGLYNFKFDTRKKRRSRQVYFLSID